MRIRLVGIRHVAEMQDELLVRLVRVLVEMLDAARC